MNNFEKILLRLKEQLGVATDKEIAELLGISDKALNARKKRDSFPNDKLLALIATHPELDIDIIYITTGDNSITNLSDSLETIPPKQAIDVALLTKLIEEMDRVTAMSNSAIPSKDKGEMIARSYADITDAMTDKESRLNAARVAGGFFERIANLYKTGK